MLKTAMTDHIIDMEKIKKMVITKKVDKDLEETILETIEGCIENAKSHLESERNQMRRIYNQGGKWATEISSNSYFDEEYTQSLE